MALFDYLSWGPINCSFSERIAWFEKNSPSDDGWEWYAETVGDFRAAVEGVENRRIWVAPRNAAEMSALYWYLHHFGGEGAQMTIADQPLAGGWRDEPPLSTGELPHELLSQLLEDDPEPWDANRFPATRWSELMREGALLRIVKDGTLQSASPDFFDDHLLRNASRQWTRWYRMVGQTMADLMEIGHAVDDSFLRWRLFELIARGDLELDGDLAVRGAPHEAAKLRRID